MNWLSLPMTSVFFNVSMHCNSPIVRYQQTNRYDGLVPDYIWETHEEFSDMLPM